MDFLQALEGAKSARSYAYAVFEGFAPLVQDQKHVFHFVFKDEMQALGAKDFAYSVFHDPNHPDIKLFTDFLDKMQDVENASQSLVLTMPEIRGQRHVLGVVKPFADPMCTLYEALATICAMMQAVKLYPEYFENLEFRFWERRRKGESAEEIENSFKTAIFNYEKVKSIIGAYKELQVHAAAGVYMCVAVQSEAQSFLRVRDFCLSRAAGVSNLLPQKGAGALPFVLVSKLIGQMKQGGARAYLNIQGLPDWNKIFEYTFAGAKNCGYTPHQIMDACAREGSLIRALSAQYPKMTEKLNMLKWSAQYKASGILQDYAAAQDFLLSK